MSAKHQVRWSPGRAFDFASWIHAGQEDKNGDAYLLHITGVGEYLRTHVGYRRLSYDEQDVAMMGAFLHDSVEDTSITSETLRHLDCPEDVIEIVALMTRRPGPQGAYYAAIKAHSLALLVKEADIASNTDPMRLRRLHLQQPDTAVRLVAKYTAACEALGIEYPNEIPDFSKPLRGDW